MTTTEGAELLQRLRKFCGGIGHEAADEIEALRLDVATLNSYIRRHKVNTSPEAVGEAVPKWRAVIASECCDEMRTNPECDCPHEHWHIGAAAGSCLDVHLEDDGSAHIIFDCGDDNRELTVKGVNGIEEARALAFGWLDGFIKPTGRHPVAADREALSRAIDPEAWEVTLPVPTRDDTIGFHRRRQWANAAAERVIAALSPKGAGE